MTVRPGTALCLILAMFAFAYYAIDQLVIGPTVTGFVLYQGAILLMIMGIVLEAGQVLGNPMTIKQPGRSVQPRLRRKTDEKL